MAKVIGFVANHLGGYDLKVEIESRYHGDSGRPIKLRCGDAKSSKEFYEALVIAAEGALEEIELDNYAGGPGRGNLRGGDDDE